MIKSIVFTKKKNQSFYDISNMSPKKISCKDMFTLLSSTFLAWNPRIIVHSLLSKYRKRAVQSHQARKWWLYSFHTNSQLELPLSLLNSNRPSILILKFTMFILHGFFFSRLRLTKLSYLVP